MELRGDATVVAARISDAIKMQPQTLIGAFDRSELAAHVSSIFHDLGYDHRVLRYQLYDDAGNLTFTSSKPGLQLDHEASVGSARRRRSQGIDLQPLRHCRLALCSAHHSGLA